VALCLLPALAMALLLLRAAVDVPAFDDYDAVVDFLNRWVASDSGVVRARLLFSQHIEHRPVPLRAAAVATHAAFGHAEGFHDHPRGVVRTPDVPDLAGAHEVVERPHGLFHGYEQVGIVRHVHVDVVGPEPPQAGFTRSDEMPA